MNSVGASPLDDMSWTKMPTQSDSEKKPKPTNKRKYGGLSQDKSVDGPQASTSDAPAPDAFKAQAEPNPLNADEIKIIFDALKNIAKILRAAEGADSRFDGIHTKLEMAIQKTGLTSDRPEATKEATSAQTSTHQASTSKGQQKVEAQETPVKPTDNSPEGVKEHRRVLVEVDNKLKSLIASYATRMPEDLFNALTELQTEVGRSIALVQEQEKKLTQQEMKQTMHDERASTSAERRPFFAEKPGEQGESEEESDDNDDPYGLFK